MPHRGVTEASARDAYKGLVLFGRTFCTASLAAEMLCLTGKEVGCFFLGFVSPSFLACGMVGI